MSTSRVDRRRWGDEDPEDEEYLPPPEETPVDENGIKQKIEYYRNEKGQTIRKITKIRVANVQLKVYNVRKEGLFASIQWKFRFRVFVRNGKNLEKQRPKVQ